MTSDFSPSVPTVAADQRTYAGFWQRFAAGFIDMLIVGAGYGAVRFVLIISLLASGVGAETLLALGLIFSQMAIIVVHWLYYAILQSGPARGTLGMRALGLVIVDEADRRISFARASARYFASMLSALFLMIGFLMIAFTPRKQGLHDILTETLVIRLPMV